MSFVLYVILLMSSFGCGVQTENMISGETDIKEETIKETRVEEKTVRTEEKDVEKTVNNPFFPYRRDVTIKCGAKFEYIEGEAALKLSQLESTQQGLLYQISYGDLIVLDSDMEAIAGYEYSKELGYLWITEDKIYFFTEYSEGVRTDLCQSGILPEGASVICQDKPVDETNKDKKGSHEYIKVKDDRVCYGSYNDLVETGFWRSFIWERGRGILVYKEGYGAGRERIELYQIEYDPYGKYGF